MTKIRDNYIYEIELEDGTIITNHNDFDKSKVVRVSFIPSIILLPRHDLTLVDMQFVKRFCRNTMGWDSVIRECLHCVVTDTFRFYLKSTNGSTLITHKDYELKV